MKPNLLISAAAGALFAMTASALAQTSVTATTDLNVRAGPGPQHPVIGVLSAGQATTLRGCIEGSKWCSVAEAGGQGWVYSDYLTGDFGGQQVVVTERPAGSVEVVTAPSGEGGAEGAVVGGTTGAVAGAIIGGPVGAAVGGVAGATIGGATGAAAEPPAEVRTFVSSNRADPVFLEGEVVVGASLPETVELREIPNYEYRYVNVNNQPVLVEPETRRIVYVMRQ
ncbi:DUF1236 domain-containing protein [Allomesorhizobium alhagi]|jgi:uncharacterized protein YraI|uniref:SH3b domain-containing protein n=1 Tax=Mesorhizobium alhagi CCNWXJ12-2 TaxID=1107882 RepID=H0HL37_9HYPH|nr:DUF1236 domain-containing protein [Mesorhizobium alhagi]EHK58521.1 hypothetical protein MAXJ12_04239 [Mesorhizobium alhagi CCNWXJ12-2]